MLVLALLLIGVVPEPWKTALVNPTPEKVLSNACNYRPIAITSLFYKIIEKFNSGASEVFEEH